ncbi:MAG: trypsin-like serine protease [Polyangiaceae bacterium]|nr:trypsin-like serine protease [Polyangiaceae bacterium]
MTSMDRRTLLLISSTALALGCVLQPDTEETEDDVDEEEVEEVEQALTPSQSPSIPQKQSFFVYSDGMWGGLPRCGAILIDPTHVLTAWTCGVPSVLQAYNNSVYPTSFVSVKSHASWGEADLGVIELDSPAPAGMVPATMAWTFPGQNAQLKVLGVGNFGGWWNVPTELRQADATVSSTAVQGGSFLTWQAVAEPGDQGGGAFWGSRLLGITNSNTWDGLNQRGKFASVPSNLAWVLDAIGYDLSEFWVHQNRTIHNLPTLQTFSAATVKVCAYACEKTSTCTAFTATPQPPFYTSQTCKLLGSGQGWQGTLQGSTAGWKL